MRPHIHELSREPEREDSEISTESFDRLAFAERAVALVRPAHTRVAIAESRSRVVVEAGRAWGRREDARWVLLCVPPRASRRAIAMAIVAIAGPERAPFALDVLLSEIEPQSEPG